MAETRVQTGLSPTIWDRKFSEEFFQDNPFANYSGGETNNPIVIKEDFAGRARGNGVIYDFITQIEQGSIKGYQPLRGHETKLGEFGDEAFWTMRKQGISMHELDVDLAAIDLRAAAKAALRDWADNDVKFETITRLQDVGAQLNSPYAQPINGAADYNTWQSNNVDRIAYGGVRANMVVGAHATSLANITSANRLSRSSVSMLSRLALTARPRITPIKVQNDNRRWFVAFVHPFTFRDFINDLSIAEMTVRLTDKNNNLFLGGDREWDGVIVHQVDDMPVLSGQGNGGIDLAPVFVLGAEALVWVVKSRYSSREELDDYEQVQGLGMLGKWGMKKAGYTIGDPSRTVLTQAGQPTNVIGKQRGMVSAFFPCISD